MTVRELITRLANFPPSANVSVGDERDGTIHGIADVTIEAQFGESNVDGSLLIIVDESETESNAYRRGALDQLFDEVSTGIAPCGATHEEIREASGENDGHRLLVAEPEGLDLDAMVRAAIENHLDLLLAEATGFVSMKLLEDWPDPDGIREMANERYWGRLDDELRNTPVDIPDEVREYDGAWDVFIGLVFDRAHKAAKAVRGY